MNDLVSHLRTLPKVELHRHLEGALRPATLWELHQQQKQTLHASRGDLERAYTIPPGSTPGFMAFLACFNALRFQFGGPENLERLAHEAVADAAADGIVHLELRFSPVFFARRMKPAGDLNAVEPLEEVEAAAAAVVRGAQRAAKEHNIEVVLLNTVARHFGLPVNAPALELLRRPVGQSLVGLDLAGDESFPCFDFAKDFLRWKAYGRGITVHAGEDARCDVAKSIGDACRMLRPSRIGHGIRAIREPQLVAQLARARAALEVCPTSNVQTCVCDGYAGHPLKALLEQNVNVTINTDDPEISRTTLSDEYALALTEIGLSWAQLRTCAINAARSAFLLQHGRKDLLSRIQKVWEAAGDPRQTTDAR